MQFKVVHLCGELGHVFGAALEFLEQASSRVSEKALELCFFGFQVAGVGLLQKELDGLLELLNGRGAFNLHVAAILNHLVDVENLLSLPAEPGEDVDGGDVGVCTAQAHKASFGDLLGGVAEPIE